MEGAGVGIAPTKPQKWAVRILLECFLVCFEFIMKSIRLNNSHYLDFLNENISIKVLPGY